MIKTDQLGKALPIIQPAVSGKSMPILGMIKIDANQDRIKLTSCNTDMQIETECDGSSTDSESFCIDADKIGRFAKSANGAMIDIKIKDGKAEMKAKSRSKLDIMPAENFHLMDLNVKGAVKVVISALSLSSAIDSVVYAAADNDPSRPYLNGVLFRVSNGVLSLISSDGCRMSRFSIDADGDDIDCIIPKKTAMTISKTFKTGDIEILMRRSAVSVFDGATRITGRCIDARFPDFSRVTDCQTESIDVDISDLISAVECSMLTSLSSGRIDLVAENNVINISASNETGESSVSSSQCVFNGSVSISVNGRYVMEAAKKLSGSIKMNVSAGKAQFITLIGADGSFHLIMSLK